MDAESLEKTWITNNKFSELVQQKLHQATFSVFVDLFLIWELENL